MNDNPKHEKQKKKIHFDGRRANRQLKNVWENDYYICVNIVGGAKKRRFGDARTTHDVGATMPQATAWVVGRRGA